MHGSSGPFKPFGQQIGDRRNRRHRHFRLGDLFDAAQQSLLAWVENRDGCAFSAGSAGSPDAMHVHFRRRGQIKIDHVRHTGNIQTAGGNVGGHEQFGLSGAEGLHDTIALGLAHTAVNRLGPVASAVEHRCDFVDFHARTAKHQGRLWAGHVQHSCEGGVTIGLGDDISRLLNARGGPGFHCFFGDADFDWV